MTIAVSKYNKKGSYIINKCQIYLQVISDIDLLIFEMAEIHPSYMKGTIPPSRVSSILWPQAPTPPKHHWSLWTQFLRFHIKPLIKKENLHWEDVSWYRFRPSFFKHRSIPHLYQHHEGGLMRYPLRTRTRGTRSIYYDYIPYQCDIEFTRDDFTPVDIHIEPWGCSWKTIYIKCTRNATRSTQYVTRSLPPPSHIP
jgi:hypothetical protein